MGRDLDVTVRLHAKTDRPVHRVGIFGIDIFINRDQYLAVTRIKCHSSLESLPRLRGIGLLHADDYILAAAARLVQGDVHYRGDVAVMLQQLIKGRLETDLAHDSALARHTLGEHLQDGMLSVGDAFHDEHAVHHLATHIAGEFAEGSLGLQVVGRDLPFDDNFRGRGYLDIDGFATHQWDRRSGDGSSDSILVAVIADLGDTR